MDPRELLERYEATGDEDDFQAARQAYHRALERTAEAQTYVDYGYLLQAHGRNVIREAVTQYERACELDPDADSPRYQLISARAALLETELEVTRYEQSLAAFPQDVRQYRFLGCAQVSAREYAQARATAEAGLALVADDPRLIELRGDARCGLGDVEGALADWSRAYELDPETLSGVYSSAFLLARVGRVEEAIGAWQTILDWAEARGFAGDAAWPRQEIERLRAASAV